MWLYSMCRVQMGPTGQSTAIIATSPTRNHKVLAQIASFSGAESRSYCHFICSTQVAQEIKEHFRVIGMRKSTLQEKSHLQHQEKIMLPYVHFLFRKKSSWSKNSSNLHYKICSGKLVFENLMQEVYYNTKKYGLCYLNSSVEWNH